jgi:FtsH-binding integral membrane protein
MGIEKAGFHLAGALFRNIGKVILAFIIFLIIGFVVMEVVTYFLSSPHQLTVLGHIVAVLFGLAIGYAAALTVIAREAIHALVAAVRTVEGDVKGELSGTGKMLQAVEQAITKGR